jgi:hypothetical protein
MKLSSFSTFKIDLIKTDELTVSARFRKPSGLDGVTVSTQLAQHQGVKDSPSAIEPFRIILDFLKNHIEEVYGFTDDNDRPLIIAGREGTDQVLDLLTLEQGFVAFNAIMTKLNPSVEEKKD